MSDKVLIEARNIKKVFPVQQGFFSRVRGWAKAVDGVDLQVFEGETLALVGESGCGKSTLARILLGLIRPTEGSVHFLGYDVLQGGASHKSVSRNMQMIFQDVYASLNPRKTVREILRQPFLTHGMSSGQELDDQVSALLQSVELTPPDTYLDRFPHEFSGGQKQRIAIARAMALRPRFIVADEPVSGLDMSVRAGILELMKRFRREFDQSYLFITHDLAIVRSVCDRVGVMYLGRIVEQTSTICLFNEHLHPYTRALLEATPIPNPRRARERRQPLLAGEVPSCVNLPTGCSFHPRCPIVQPICREQAPCLREARPGHLVACHFA